MPIRRRLAPDEASIAAKIAHDGSNQQLCPPPSITFSGEHERRIEAPRSLRKTKHRNITRAAVRAGLRQGNSRLDYVADLRSTPALRQGQPQTHKRTCGSRSANQSLITDVFRSRPLPCTIKIRSIHAIAGVDRKSARASLDKGHRVHWRIADAERLPGNPPVASALRWIVNEADGRDFRPTMSLNDPLPTVRHLIMRESLGITAATVQPDAAFVLTSKTTWAKTRFRLALNQAAKTLGDKCGRKLPLL